MSTVAESKLQIVKVLSQKLHSLEHVGRAVDGHSANFAAECMKPWLIDLPLAVCVKRSHCLQDFILGFRRPD